MVIWVCVRYKSFKFSFIPICSWKLEHSGSGSGNSLHTVMNLIIQELSLPYPPDASITQYNFDMWRRVLIFSLICRTSQGKGQNFFWLTCPEVFAHENKMTRLIQKSCQKSEASETPDILFISKQNKFHIHHNVKLRLRFDIHLTFTWYSPDHLTIIWPSPDPNQTLSRPLPNLD